LRGAFLVEDFDGTKSPSQFTFDKAAFWVRMINLPLACMGREIGRKIGACVGVVEVVDTDARGMGWGSSSESKFLLIWQNLFSKVGKLILKVMLIGSPSSMNIYLSFVFNAGQYVMENRGVPERAIFDSRRRTNMGHGLGLLLPLEELSRATIGF
jgi:hypothetical protein